MDRIRRMIEDKSRPVKWLFYGDSITQGVHHTFGWRDYTQLFAERIRCELDRRQDIVINTAISGNGIANLLKDYDWRCRQFRPDVVFIMIGMNDCCGGTLDSLQLFHGQLEELICYLSADGALAVLQTSCAILPGGSPKREPMFGQFMDAIRDVARSERVPLIDHHRYWTEHSENWPHWLTDPFHPNEKGHRALAFKLFSDLGIFDVASDTCRLPIT